MNSGLTSPPNEMNVQKLLEQVIVEMILMFLKQAF